MRAYTLPPRGQRAAGDFAPLHPRRRAFLPLDPDHIHGGQPCAGWIRGNRVSRCIAIQGSLAPPKPPASGLPRPDTHGQEHGPCTPIHELPWRSIGYRRISCGAQRVAR